MRCNSTSLMWVADVARWAATGGSVVDDIAQGARGTVTGVLTALVTAHQVGWTLIISEALRPLTAHRGVALVLRQAVAARPSTRIHAALCVDTTLCV